MILKTCPPSISLLCLLSPQGSPVQSAPEEAELLEGQLLPGLDEFLPAHHPALCSLTQTVQAAGICLLPTPATPNPAPSPYLSPLAVFSPNLPLLPPPKPTVPPRASLS